MTRSCSIYLEGEEAMLAFGERLGILLHSGVVFLEGELGAGKTTLCRGILRGRGHRGAVKSPTYTLVEPYDVNGGDIYHFDLYRLGDPEELEFMGARDYFRPGLLCLVEWPERGEGFLPRPDLEITLGVEGEGRAVTIMARTPSAETVLRQLHESDQVRQ